MLTQVFAIWCALIERGAARRTGTRTRQVLFAAVLALDVSGFCIVGESDVRLFVGYNLLKQLLDGSGIFKIFEDGCLAG